MDVLTAMTWLEASRKEGIGGIRSLLGWRRCYNAAELFTNGVLCMNPQEDHLIWIDLEMTGLEPDRDTIIEIATVVTDSQLAVVAEGPVLAIHQPDSILEGMDEWNIQHHGASGLIERVRQSEVTMAEAERQTLAFVRQFVPPRASPMCGNSICQDRRFLARWMPELERFFHYRNLDVSTIKELARRWYPDVAMGVVKQGRHEALADIRESIEELIYYREQLFRVPQGGDVADQRS
ncbi:MAG: oligoribonuclease [Gammaproteobacteria bacterium]